MNDSAETLIAKAIDERMLGPSSANSRFAAQQLTRAILSELTLSGFSIVKHHRRERPPIVIDDEP